LDRSDGLMKLRIPSKHRRIQDQHQFNSMQYAEHERAPIPVPRILSRNRNSSSWLLLLPKNGPIGMSVKRRNGLHNRASVATVQSFTRRHQSKYMTFGLYGV